MGYLMWLGEEKYYILMSIQYYEDKCKYSIVNNSTKTRKIYTQTSESYDKTYFLNLHI